MDTHTYGLAILLYAIVATLHGIIPTRYNIVRNLLYKCTECMVAIVCFCIICVYYCFVIYSIVNSVLTLSNDVHLLCKYICMAIYIPLSGLFGILQTRNGRIVIWWIICLRAREYLYAIFASRISIV